MRRFFDVMILSGVVFCALLNGFAQEKVVAVQELDALETNGYEKLKGKTYRVTMISNIYKNAGDSSPYYSANEISEYALPDRQRTVYETISEKGKTRYERISIGQKKYVKVNNEDWKDLQPLTGRSTVQGNTVEDKQKVEATYKGQTKIKNQIADLYEIKVTNEYETANGRTSILITNIKRFWFSKDGMFLKREYESKRDNDQDVLHTTWEYDYDSKIKIEAPIIKSESKPNPK